MCTIVPRLMRLRLLLVGLVLGVLCLGVGPAVGAIYQNRAFTFAERAADLVARMTLAEKSSQMVSSQAAAISRLGIKAYGWWNEAAHGVANMQFNPGFNNLLYNTTSYPTNLSMGASWDPSLMYSVASAIGDEARQIAPQNSRNLDFFAPTVNLSRDPRWGRNDETFSEDPFLTAAIASQFVNGLEGETTSGRPLSRYLKTIATLKHYAANNDENNRLCCSSDMDERTLREYYTSQFGQIIAQSHPGAVMSAYNAVNGRPASVSDHLISALARQSFGFGGYFTSDCDAIDDVVAHHHWRPDGYGRNANNTEARAIANAVGVDMNCVDPYNPFNYQGLLPAATQEGIRTPLDLYNVNDMDTSVARLFTARMELGEFDSGVPWVKQARASLGSWTNSDANNAVTETPGRLFLDRQAASRSLVLLKNATIRRNDGVIGPVLPIHVPSSGPFRVAVIGYFGTSMFLGDYSSIQGGPGQARSVTPYAGLKAAIQSINPGAAVDFYRGFVGGKDAGTLTTIDPNAVAAAAGYNDVIVVVGTDPSVMGEGYNRYSLGLYGAQSQLISQVAARNPNTVAVMETAGPVTVDGFAPGVPAMLWSSYNGQRQGEGLADVVLGTYNPSGHLPFTWYPNEHVLPGITDYRIRPGGGSPGRTYMYYGGPVSFPFGYGLSYTNFSVSGLSFSRLHFKPDQTIRMSVNVTNAGPAAGEDLVQMYVTSPAAGNGAQPIKRLEGFQQVSLSPGQTKTIQMTLRPIDLGLWNGTRYSVSSGVYTVQIADSAQHVLLARYIGISGKLTPVPQTVSASPQMPGDASRRISQRLIFPVGTTVLPQLTVSTNDSAMYGFLSLGHSRRLPAGMTFSYSSDRPRVVSVAGGVIRTVGNGVATVTARVSFHGASASTQFVVKATSELGGISIRVPAQTKPRRGKKGKSKSTAPGFVPLPHFYPDTYNYDVIVPEPLDVPRITATKLDRVSRIRVKQAPGLPGTASVAVTGSDGLTKVYRVHFARPALSQSFAAPIGPRWSFIRRDPSSETQAGGSYTIAPQPGNLDNHTARNLLLEPALGNWTITAKLTFSSPPPQAGQEAGIIAYTDDNDYLKFDLENDSRNVQLAETTEDSLSGAPASQLLATFQGANRLGNTLWLKMVKSGQRYTTYFSTDGSNFVPFYNVGANLTNVKVGVFGFGGLTNAGLRVSFANFAVHNTGPVSLASLH
jgi:beta-glucosidase